MAAGTVVVVGGTQGLGRELAQSYADEGRDVIVTGRDQSRAETPQPRRSADAHGGSDSISPSRTRSRATSPSVGAVDHLVLAAIERDVNNVHEYDIAAALRLVTLKLVGYTEVDPRLVAAASRRLQRPDLRRARARPAVSRLDNGDNRQRRGDEPRADARDRARAHARERAPPGDRRRQPAVARHASGAASRRSSTGRRSGGS